MIRVIPSGGAATRARAARVRVARTWASPAAVALILALLLPAAGQAAPDWRSTVREQMEQPNTLRPQSISVDQCAELVRRETGGRVLSATPVERGGQRGCQVRVLVDGKRVKSVYVDADGRIRPGS